MTVDQNHSVMQVQNCCFANLYLLLFCRFRWRRRRRCLSSLIFGQAHLYTSQHALVYVCPWSNTVNAEGLAGSVLNGAGSFARNGCLACEKKRVSLNSKFKAFIGASLPKVKPW